MPKQILEMFLSNCYCLSIEDFASRFPHNNFFILIHLKLFTIQLFCSCSFENQNQPASANDGELLLFAETRVLANVVIDDEDLLSFRSSRSFFSCDTRLMICRDIVTESVSCA